MQSGGGGGPQQGGRGRSTVGGLPSSAASPSSSSSAVSNTQLGFDPMEQQIQRMQLLQQQLLRKPDGNEAGLAYQSGSLYGMLGGGTPSTPYPQQSRKDSFQQHGREEGQNRTQGFVQPGLNSAQSYLQYVLQAQHAQQKSALGVQAPQAVRMGMVGSGQTSAKDQDSRIGNPIPDQNQQEAVSLSDQNKRSLPSQSLPGNMMRLMQAPQQSQSLHAIGNSQQSAMASQMQALQALALERNIDLSLPQNANLVAQLLPHVQSRILSQSRTNESNESPVSFPKPMVSSPQVTNESSFHGNSSSDLSVHPGNAKLGNSIPSSSTSMQHFPIHGRENQMNSRQPHLTGNGSSPVHPSLSSMNLNQGVDHSTLVRRTLTADQSSQLTGASSGDVGMVNPSTSHSGPVTQMQRFGFTRQQQHVFKAQILAFRRLKKREKALPRELLQAIVPPPLEAQAAHVGPPTGTVNQGRLVGRMFEDKGRCSESSEKDLQASTSDSMHKKLKEDAFVGDDKATESVGAMQVKTAVTLDTTPVARKEDPNLVSGLFGKEEQKSDGCGLNVDRVKVFASQASANSDNHQTKKQPADANSVPQQPKDLGSTRKYHGPLFDFPFFTRKHDGFGSSMMLSANNNLTLAYSVKDILGEEGTDLINKKRHENMKKIKGLLAVNLERKRIRPDLVLKLQIEEKKLRLMDLQARVREQVDQQQQDIMAMPDRPYRKFVRLCERQRMDLNKQVRASRRAIREKQLKSIFQWRKKLLEAHWAIRDARTARNKGVAKYHEKILKEFSKTNDDRSKRMEALKNNDVERYREMLLEQQSNVPGEAAERYEVLSSFLSQTEDYLHKLGGKITAAKNQQEVEEAAAAAAAAARAQGLSEEEVRAAASCAREEVLIRNHFSEMNAPKESSSVSKYYTLAHAVNERVTRQPSMLRKGTLRDYQLVGLQWMLSLYNNKLNGILADEMGLGKTVQVMALIGYLMEFKGNYGPHLIIVPNAVLVNWKSELHSWLPSASCIYYVGSKDHRAKLFSQEVCAMKFNILVTTYEFVMFDRSKLSRIDWKYIIIDEAQRMKDRESVLARDLDKYRCQRRLLLTGTPLQNDLKELWSLLNLLLPEVFDNRKAFHDWFSQPFQKESQNAEDDWLETEKKVIVIHRLHQILEPFMLRRRVEDVEGSLPPKISIVLRCRMSAIQGAIYDWVKSTNTIRVDPDEESLKVQRNSMYQPKAYKPLKNKCMELRKVCNHPLLSYPYFSDLSKEFLVRSCGKLWILDRILIKLQRSGHRVLLFSTMTKLLDILEEYLQWRRLVFRRIDGTTSLEDRESAIVDFNSPDTDCFIFLLSIRAAGRGLNLQTADTVVIYDPDPNPKNEEQAVARAHRIGQTREVKVIYMEAVVDKISSHQKEDELRSGGAVDSEEDDMAGKDRYMGSIESLIRNNIQQYKIDMADEVINAGRFDQRTTHEERRSTLETLLRDEDRYQETVHDVPSLHQVNRMIARSEEEVELFDQMDEELDWVEEMTRYDQVPKWLRTTTRDVNHTVASLSKKPSNSIFNRVSIAVESGGMASDPSAKIEEKRGRRKGKIPSYVELDDDIDEFFEASSEERNGNSEHEEEEEEEAEEIGDSEEGKSIGAVDPSPVDKDHSEEDGQIPAGRYVSQRPSGVSRNNHTMEGKAVSSGSSFASQRSLQRASPGSSRKFGSLSALEGRPGSLSKRMIDDLEEGEIATSGDSHTDLQQSGNWNHDPEEGEGDQVLQKPQLKRKRSIRLRPRQAAERPEEKSAQLPLQVKTESEHRFPGAPKAYMQEKVDSSLKTRQNLPSRKNSNKEKVNVPSRPSRASCLPTCPEDTVKPHRDFPDVKASNSRVPSGGTKITEETQRRCKNAISKMRRRIDKEGQQIVPLLTELWKRTPNPGSVSGAGNNLIVLGNIEQRIDRFDYKGVMEFISDVQLMLKSGIQYFGCSREVRTEARKVHDLFFDILKIAFPDSDFREAKNAVSFAGPTTIAASPSVSSPRQQVLAGQTKRKKPTTVVEPDPSPPQKSSTRKPIALPSSDDARTTGFHMSQRETRVGSSSRDPVVNPQDETRTTRSDIAQRETRIGSSRKDPVVSPQDETRTTRSHIAQRETRIGSSSKDPVASPHDESLFTHPGDLVVCKKKRKDREKLGGKSGNGSVPGVVSPTSAGHGIRSPGLGSGTFTQGGGSIGWANPVKRMRTDTGKRRPSQL